MKIITVVPIDGRELLLKHTISRLVRQVFKVICGGQTDSECEICETAGADFYYCDKGMLLGTKWQRLVDIACEYSPDALLIMGSASMISDNWCSTLYPDLERYAMTGSAGIYYYHVGNNGGLAFWSGYIGGRSNEPVGVGRLISGKFLDKINWQIFPNVNRGLDHSCMRKIQGGGGDVKVHRKRDICSLRISCDKWANMDNYHKMIRNSRATILKDFSILDKFPEVKEFL